MTTKRLFAWFLLSPILLLAPRLVAADDPLVMSDFKLWAQYSPGYSDWKPWKVTITADGKALQEIGSPFYTNAATEKILNLTGQQLRELVAIVRSSQFFELKKRYWYAVTDNPTLTLRVTMNGSSQEVQVYAPSHLGDNSEVNRFMKIWNVVLSDVPPPNADQKPK